MSESIVDAVEKTSDAPIHPNKDMSLEALVLLITTERLKHLKDKTRAELTELKERQEKVRTLHKLLRAINLETGETGQLEITEEIKELIEEVKALGFDVKADKSSYTREERDRLVENLRIGVEDYNVENEMQIQAISRWTNERYETYQMARSILRPLHDDKQRKAREISGR